MKPSIVAPRVVFAALAISAAGLASPAFSATDGTLGATSTGTVSITASVPNRAQISGLADVDFTNQDPASAASDPQDICVWSNTATKAYTITASGSGAGSAFTLSNGASTVPYQVQWAGASGALTGDMLAAGAASASYTSGAANQDCSSGPSASASLIVDMAAADLGTMSAGASYTGTLTLLVTPL